jgi:membrane-bound lytic murein transglycosylase A
MASLPSAAADAAASRSLTPGSLQPGDAGTQPGIATRHALFKVSAFDALPGWQQDSLDEAWAAFKASCKALERKPSWAPLCAQVKAIKDPQAGRTLLEREFTLLSVQNADRTREGDITGYYEPLLAGQAQRGGAFVVPVYGPPNDLYALDPKSLPAAQRKGVAWVRPSGRVLLPAQAGQPGAIKVDLRAFTLDTLDRRLRVRLQGGEGLPYYTRADISRQAALNGLDAPVLAWVDDPLALYAMQVQGTGRIKLPDGRVLRLQYADQNGHPFKPMQLAAQGNERVQTRGRAAAGRAADADADADSTEHFELADAADAPDMVSASAEPSIQADTATDEPLTRGARPHLRPASPSPSAPVTAPATAAFSPPPAQAAVKAARPTANPAGQQVLDDLLQQAQAARRPAQVSGAGAAPLAPLEPLAAKPAKALANAPAKQPSATALSNTLLAQRSRALDADPSYVFFRVAPDQSSQGGPVGALGVPLTAGRSLAVDPRVLPLGYPVFLDAAGGGPRTPALQRLMFAQDTGGAIRGAVRADYFWGFGPDAGRQARRTKHRGRMWLMVPKAEAEALLSSRLLTRGKVAPAEPPDCLMADAAYCDTAVDTDAAPDAFEPSR